MPLDFQAAVLDASHDRPILVDFWAPWCGPCRALGPTLEGLDAEAGDAWDLVKVNTDERPDLGAAYAVRSIPAVKLFSGGAVVAEFTGALPEPEVRRWLDEHVPGPGRAHFDAGLAALADGDRPAARAAFAAALDAEPGAGWAAAARLDLARLSVFDDPAGARALVFSAFSPASDAVRTVADALLRDASALPGGPSREAYAGALDALRTDRLDDALGALVGLVQTDRGYDDDGARRLAVALFQTLGDDHPAVQTHRPVFNRSLY